MISGINGDGWYWYEVSVRRAKRVDESLFLDFVIEFARDTYKRIYDLASCSAKLTFFFQTDGAANPLINAIAPTRASDGKPDVSAPLNSNPINSPVAQPTTAQAKYQLTRA